MKNWDEKMKIIFQTYWPLAVSWLFMGMDTPAITAFVSRMNDPKNVLAAHGTSYPQILLIEAPIIMLTSASLTLSVDGKNYKRIRRLMLILCSFVTFMHILICVPPVFRLVFIKLLGTPSELLPYCHEELLWMIPWSGLIGFRRFNQGVLIRCGKSQKVTVGTVIRMVTMFASLGFFLLFKDHFTGACAAGVSMTLCVAFESLYNGIEGGKVAGQQLLPMESEEALISWPELISFVIPLILTTIMNNIWMSIGSGAVSRMIDPVVSLAVWPVISSLLNLLKCWGNAINETALAKLPVPGMRKPLARFTFYVSVFTLLLCLIFAVPPMNDIWYVNVSSLRPELVSVSKSAFPFVILAPLLTPLQNFYQAILMKGKRTRAIFESLVVFLIVMFSVLGFGLAVQRWMGIYMVVIGMSLAAVGQTLWLKFRVRQLERNAENA